MQNIPIAVSGTVGPEFILLSPRRHTGKDPGEAFGKVNCVGLGLHLSPSNRQENLIGLNTLW